MLVCYHVYLFLSPADVGFTAYPGDDTVEVGDAVTLECAVDTPSTSSSFKNVSAFQWYQSGTEITSGKLSVFQLGYLQILSRLSVICYGIF